MYHGGGYAVELNLDTHFAQEVVSKLESLNWIDRFTRFVVLESTVFNVNSRLFSRLKTYFEISQAGQVVSGQKIDSMRLYPYVEIGDYVTLTAQLVFIALTIIRLLMFIYTMAECHCTVGDAFNLLLELIRLMMAFGYVAFYVWRIDRTIYAVEALMNNKGEVIFNLYKYCFALFTTALLQPGRTG